MFIQGCYFMVVFHLSIIVYQWPDIIRIFRSVTENAATFVVCCLFFVQEQTVFCTLKKGKRPVSVFRN